MAGFVNGVASVLLQSVPKAKIHGVDVNTAGTFFNSNSDPLKVFPNLCIPPLAQDLTG